MKFVIIGAGQTGQLVAEIVSRLPELECVGMLDQNSALHGQRFYGVPVLGSEDDLVGLRAEVPGALPVIGDLAARFRMFLRCRELGFRLVNVIDPSVNRASDLRLGEGVFISCGTNILTHVEIHDYAFIGTGVNILHDTTIGENCVIGGGSTIGASVTVGKHVSFGVGVQVASGSKRIGDNTRVSAGSVILKDIPDNVVVLGNPARVIDVNPSIEVDLEDAWP